jgi:L,D-peptidoglycan transpeptidase YkuD (ErfK/YbiS/YcfS/YnhG family)
MLRVLAAALALHACPGPAGSQQLVTVVAPSARTTYAVVRLWERRGGGCWMQVAGPWAARVGRNGLSARHREGDGTTPTGTFGFGRVVYGLESAPAIRYAYHRLVCGDWWDEDPASPTYNTFRHVACRIRPPFAGGSEALWRATVAYRRFAVVDYNRAAVPGRGSAIFVHVDTGRATNGCVSLPAARLDTLLRWLRPAAAPRIAIGTAAGLSGFVR